MLVTRFNVQEQNYLIEIHKEESVKIFTVSPLKETTEDKSINKQIDKLNYMT